MLSYHVASSRHRPLISFAHAQSPKHRRQQMLGVRQADPRKCCDSHSRAVAFDLMVCVCTKCARQCCMQVHNYDWQLFIPLSVRVVVPVAHTYILYIYNCL